MSALVTDQQSAAPYRPMNRPRTIPARQLGKMVPLFPTRGGVVKSDPSYRICVNSVYGCRNRLSRYNPAQECECCQLRRKRYGP